VREIEQSIDALRRTGSEMSRGLRLQTEAEWMGGFGVVIRNLETNEVWVSEGAYRIFGLRRLSAMSSAELVNAVVHPEDVEAVQAVLATGVENGEYDIVHRIIRPDGEERLVHSKGRRIEATDGHSPVLLGTIVDVTPDT
jgi:PAS domain S-box-containing protein